jgi:hypothetical protein
MEEGLLFDRIDLQRTDVTMGDTQGTVVVHPDLADPHPLRRNPAPVSAGMAGDLASFQPFAQVAFDAQTVEPGFECFPRTCILC